MRPFQTLIATAASLPIANIDTDKILPARFLKTITRAGLGKALLHHLREDPGFALNRSPWSDAKILIVGENFGCGSSREHAPWALLDFGIRCIIGPSIAEIFAINCFKNGILPIVLPPKRVNELAALAADSATAEMTVDLVDQRIAAGGRVVPFEVDARRRHYLLEGIDEIVETERYQQDIEAFEMQRRDRQPWIRAIIPEYITAKV